VPVKEFFYTGTSFNANRGDFRVRTIATDAAFRFSFPVPADLVTLVSVGVMGIPELTNPAAQIDLLSDYGAVGEAFNTHSESDLGGTFAVVDDELFELDVTSVFSALAAGDRCGIRVDHMAIGGNIDYIGVRMAYT